MGDTAISLHIRAPRNLGGGVVQTNSTQSAKICPNLHFQGEGRGVVQTNSTQSAKICPNLHSGGGIQTNSTQSAKICPNLHFWVGGGEGGGVSDQHSWNTWVGALKEFWAKNSGNWNV